METTADKVTIHDRTFRLLIPYERLAEAFDSIAARISADFAPTSSPEDPLVLICVLNGSIMFCGELMKRLNFPCRVVSTKLSSYSGMESAGPVKQSFPLTGSVKGSRCIVVEDIVDTGKSIAKMKAILEAEGAAQIAYCSMLLKPDKYSGEIPIDYIGLEIPNDFIVGFGLDYDEQGRNLPHIYTLDI